VPDLKQGRGEVAISDEGPPLLRSERSCQVGLQTDPRPDPNHGFIKNPSEEPVQLAG
jgi:hypothetical protein